MFKTLYLTARRARVSLLLLAIALSTQHQLTPAQTAAPRQPESAKQGALSGKERVKVFEEVWKTINDKYYDPTFNGVDWKAVHDNYRPRVEAAMTETEFYALLNQMAGELKDAHTRVRSPRQSVERKKLQATSAGVMIYEVEGTPVIFDVAADSDASRAGVLPGMVVRTIDGQPVAKALAEARREIGTSSTERAARILTYGKLVAGEPDTQLTLGLLRGDGSPLEVTLMRRTISAAPQFTSRLLPSGFAYLKFNRFRSPVAKQVKEALEKFKDAPGLILDLRSNGGGDGMEGLRVAGYFFNEKVALGRMLTRTGKTPSALFGLVSLPKVLEAGEKGHQLYAHPLAILINEATGSASELVVGGMQEQQRGTVIGTQSCGCVLGILKHRSLKGGGELAISEIGFMTPKGRMLEGRGITPDKIVALTLEDLTNGHDAALQEAEKFLNDLLQRK